MNPDTNVSLAHAHGYLKISRNPLLRLFRDVSVKDVSTRESEIDLSVEPRNFCDQATDEHNIIKHSQTSKIDTHKSPVSARFSDDFDEDDVILVEADLSVPLFAENLDEKRPVVGTIGATSFEGDLLHIAMEKSCQSCETELGRHEHTASSSRRKMTPPSCPLGSKPMIRRQNRLNKGDFWVCQQWPKCNGTRRPWEWGKDEIKSAAQHLVSSCWNRAVRLGRPGLLEVCANSDSPLVEAVESAGGEGLRTPFLERVRSDHQARSRTSLSVLFSEKAQTRLVLFTLWSLWSTITTRLVFWMESLPWFRECKRLVVTFILHSVSSWRQNSLLGICPRR